jgi:hypothetical protein
MSSLMLLGGRHLHALVYFVADSPAADNISPDIPLVGTDSYRTLLRWIGEMDIDITRVRLYNQIDGPFDHALPRTTLNTAVRLNQIRVIALGQKAADYLGKVGIEEYFVLPHPSGLNRQLNDKEYVKNKLGFCRTYIYEGVMDGIEERQESIEEDLSGALIISADEQSSQLE